MKKILFLSLFISFKMLGQSVTISPTDQSSLKVTNPKGSAKISITGVGAGGVFDFNNITGNATLDLSSSPLGDGGESTINFGKYSIFEYYDPYFLESGFVIKNVNNTIFSHSGNEQKIYTMPLEINGTSATTLKLTNNTPLASNIKNQIDFVIGGTYGIQGSIGVTGVTANTARMGFFTGYGTPIEKLSIDADGKVGIGLTSPNQILDINGRMRIRHTPGYTSGVWMSNSTNGLGDGDGAFIGLNTDTQAGIYIGNAWRFGFNSNGNAVITGFTQLGNTTPAGADASATAPAIKTMLLTGTTASTEGGEASVATGLLNSKILSYNVLVQYYTSEFQPENSLLSGVKYHTFMDAGYIYIRNSPISSESILNKSFKVLVTYIE